MFNILFIPINRAGWPFILLFGLITFASFLLWVPLGWVCFVLTLWCLYFFRDPKRVTPTRIGLIVSPADGIVQEIKNTLPPQDFGLKAVPFNRISIFMNVFIVSQI